MTSWLNLIPAILTAATRDEEVFVTELRRVPEGWLGVGGLALIAAVCWLVIWMYRHEGRTGASPRARMVMAGIRCLVIACLALIFLEPVRVRILRQWIDSYTVVLVDTSSSMDLADTYRDEALGNRVRGLVSAAPGEPLRRAAVVEHLLSRDDRAFLKGLAANNRVHVHTFSDEPNLHATIRAAWERPSDDQAQEDSDSPVSPALSVGDVPLSLTAVGTVTNIERAVRRSVESLGGSPIAGVVVISDGGFNQGGAAEDVARFARDRRIPIHVIGVGDPSPPRNIRVTEVTAPENVFENDPFAITARLSADGLEETTLSVQLRERDATRGGEGQVIAGRQVNVRSGGVIEPVVFERRPERVGRYVYTVEVPVLEGESVIDDNSRQTTVNVIDSRTRVLLISGSPSWDYQFLSRLLQRDSTVDLSCWLQSADLRAVRDGNTVIDHLPVLAEDLFAYDVIILMDPQHQEFDDAWARLIDTWVTQHGGGLLYSAARANTPFFFQQASLKPLIDLLPVSPDPEADLVLNQVGHYQLSGSPFEVPATALNHPAMQIEGDAASSRLAWQGVRSVYWHYPVLREKSVATVLLRHGAPQMRNAFGGHVLGAVQFVGAGRSAYLGFDGSWRWRRHQVEWFDRFWVQMVRYLAEGRLLGGTRQGMLVTEADEYAMGESVTVSARLFDSRFEPLRRDQVTAEYAFDNERNEFVLQARPDQPGWFEGRFIPDRVGSYRISLKPPRAPGEEPLEIVREIRVSRPNIEMIRPQMDRAALVTLAENSHQGEYFDVDQALDLPSRIPDLHAEIPIRSRPTTLWDRGIVLAILIGLLSVEWAARKWNRLL